MSCGSKYLETTSERWGENKTGSLASTVRESESYQQRTTWQSFLVLLCLKKKQNLLGGYEKFSDVLATLGFSESYIS